MTIKEQMKRLQEQFNDNEIEWRVQQVGIKSDGTPWAILVPYPDARALMKRLDEVIGMENWMDEYEIYDKGVICKLTIIFIDGANLIKVTKADGADYTGSEDFSFKGGLTDAFKRACVKFNIGNIRVLYEVKTVFAKDMSAQKPQGRYIHIVDKAKNINMYCPMPKLSEIIKGE